MSNSALDFPLEIAQSIASRYLDDCLPFCQRIEIAGSIRRRKPIIHDIEIVALPIFRPAPTNMFGEPVGIPVSLVDENVHALASAWGAVFKKSGPKYKQLQLAEGLNLDLFLVTPPADWGVILAIRTGPGDFSNQLVTRRSSRTHEGRPGLLPSWAKVEDGRVIHRDSGTIHPMPEESDFLALCGVADLSPENRK